MSQFPSNEAIAKNKQLPCSVEGCSAHRSSMGKYCERHRKANTRNGHPLQRRIPLVAYATEKHQVEELFQANPKHPGVLLATVWIQEWMGSAFPEEMGRLQRYGVTPLDLLTGITSMWLYQQSHPEMFFSEKAADIALSLAVLGLAPKDSPLPFKGKVLRTLGKAARARMEPLFRNMQTAINTPWDDLGAAFEDARRVFIPAAAVALNHQDR